MNQLKTNIYVEQFEIYTENFERFGRKLEQSTWIKIRWFLIQGKNTHFEHSKICVVLILTFKKVSQNCLLFRWPVQCDISLNGQIGKTSKHKRLMVQVHGI